MEETVDPNVNKTVNGKDSLELENRNQAFTWEVDFDFGNRTGKWDVVELSDKLHQLLEIVEVEVVDQAGNDVSSNGVLNVNKKTNLVSFKPEKKDNSYLYLQDQVYKLKIKSKISDTATPQELLPYIEANGIPNEGVLTVDDIPTTSNEAYVKPPELKGALTITKVDKETKSKLAGAEFELQDEKGDVIATKTTDDNGEITFEYLPLGDYQLVETKAPTYIDENGGEKTYRLLAKPIDISITAKDLHVQKDIENSKSAWLLPSTGGIGSLVFYVAGAVLMIGAIVWLLKRRKQEMK
nr:SpaA isopeptide-forming pilin-related protein [Roseburia sp. 1XD42-34]